MATNLELKARLSSPPEGHVRARLLGAVHQGLLVQRDTYFHVPEGRLKLRESPGHEAELIYYQREESSPERWSHYRREPVTNPEGLRGLLEEALGVSVVVEKRRELYIFRNARIHIDEVSGLGAFIEFEVMGEESADSHETMGVLKRAFQIGEGEIIRGSYSDMIQGKTIAGDS